MKHKKMVFFLILFLFFLVLVFFIKLPRKKETSSLEEGEVILKEGASITQTSTVTIKEDTITFTKGGTYQVTGSLESGSLVIDAKGETVELILNNVTVHNNDGPAILVKNAEAAILTLVENSINTFTDGDNEREENATIYSEDDLTIQGTGKLMVEGKNQDGIASRNTLTIVDGTYVITAQGDGIRGKDALLIKGGTYQIAALADGLKASNDTEEAWGYLTIENGTFTIEAGGDAIQAETDVTIQNGTYTLKSGAGLTSLTTESAKGIKAGGQLTISKGTLIVTSLDDAIHSNDSVLIENGTLELASGDDAIHAENQVTILDGTLSITKSVEGIEGKHVSLEGGTLQIKSSDDGINATDGSSGMGKASTDVMLMVKGGTIVLEAGGDGLDSNGSIEISGGKVLVNGPTSNGNGAIDYDGTMTVTGGTLLAAGSSGMVQTPSASSKVPTLSLSFPSTLSASTLVSIWDSNGKEILTFAPSKSFQSLVITSPLLETGKTYTIYYGGTTTAKGEFGLYETGLYQKGTLFSNVTISSSITKVGTSYGGMPFR